MRPRRARLVKKATDDGLVEFKDEVGLGTVYTVDMDRMGNILAFDVTTGKLHLMAMVWDIENGAWLPTECLRM